ncbi:MAG: tRNA pseudouridine(55) synthase TruB [Thermomicrobium sp.]|nr:tRNA pseudouridine(55) synthase TruB [Thermomicrobium sp.]MDW7981730.1 tRNA pseudouridine(55) synthase TruB [Thermomicrobium sp.]
MVHGVLLLDKPRGWTSHDAVAWVRRRLHTRAVGHGGTLDPAAEGVLLLAVGVATRLLQYALEADKSYVAHIVLGAATTTDDLEGELLGDVPETSPPSVEAIRLALAEFHGVVAQRPPLYSSIKVRGTPAHRKTRAGQQPELPPRTVEVQRIELLRYTYPDLVVAIDCRKGFYVRSFARDLGQRLGTQGYVHGLVRTRIGAFGLDQAWTIRDLEEWLYPETWSLVALHPDTLVGHLPLIVVPESQLPAWYHGAPVRSAAPTDAEVIARAYAPDGLWIGLARYDVELAQWRPVLVHRA